MKKIEAFSLWLRLRTQLVSMRMQVQTLAPLGGLRIQHCHERWCRSQIQLGSGIAVAVAVAGSLSSDLTPSLRTSLCHRCGYKKEKKKKKIGIRIFRLKKTYNVNFNLQMLPFTISTKPK